MGPISGEHIISESVIRVLMADGEFSVSGSCLGWKKAKTKNTCAEQFYGRTAFAPNTIARIHRLDDAAKYFFASLKSYLELDKGTKHALVSGHDIERWLLKTAKAAAVSKNLARKKERLSGIFSQDKVLLDMLDSPIHWQDGAGLYCMMKTGDLATNHPRFQLQPLTNDEDDIEAMALNILGLSFVLLLEPLDLAKYPFLRDAKYRPEPHRHFVSRFNPLGHDELG